MHHYGTNSYRLASDNLPRQSGGQQPRAFGAPSPANAYETYSSYDDRGDDGEDSGMNAYGDEHQAFTSGESGVYESRGGYGPAKNTYAPYYGMDVRLAQFVNEHNVNMDDGAVIYPLPGEEIIRNKRPK